MTVFCFDDSRGESVFRYEYNGEFVSEDYAGQLVCDILNLRKLRECGKGEIDLGAWTVLTKMKSKYDIFNLIDFINSSVDNGKASYEYFQFMFTNFFDYKPSPFPMPSHKVRILDYICPLIEAFYPKDKQNDEYEEMLNKIDNSKTPFDLTINLGLLEEFIDEFDSSEQSIQQQLTDIRLLIHYYLDCYADPINFDSFFLTPFDVTEDERAEIELNELLKLNQDTTPENIHKIFDNMNIQQPPWLFADFLYSFNNQFGKIYKRQHHYLADIGEVICHAVLFCYNKNIMPLKRCKYCGLLFPRRKNRQETCSACKGKTGQMSKDEMIQCFGVDLNGKLNLLYKKFCYSGSPYKFAIDKYTHDGYYLNKNQSAKLVYGLEKLKDEYCDEKNEYCEKYKVLTSPYKEEYAQAVKRWIDKICNYYKAARIKESITNSSLNKFVIKKFSIPTDYTKEELDEADYVIKLY